MKPDVIIGAGIGGLSAAIHLALADRRVIVLEQNDAVGGKMGEVRQNGFRWDTGPSVITMKNVIDAVFQVAGRRVEDYLALEPVEPLTRYFYDDGTVFDASANLPKMASEIAKINLYDVEGYLAYLAHAARIHRITSPAFIYGEPPSWRSLLEFSPLDVLKIDATRTVAQSIRGFVDSEKMQQLLGRFATYVGASPYLAPATLNVIAHVELVQGVWYPRGGIYSIARALEQLAMELGVEVRTGCGVKQINLDAQSRVTGVNLVDGTTMEAGSVIANVDVATVYERLLPAAGRFAKRREALKRVESSCSGFILLLEADTQHADLAHHNIFFSSDYEREFDDIFKRGVPPDEPTIYVAITSKTDTQDAPDGSENWFVLVNAPPLGDGFDWETEVDRYTHVVMERLAAFGCDVRRVSRIARRFTPIDLELMTGARRGALYGTSSNNRMAAFRRPHNRASDVSGLYFAGGTTHPGGGVPMVTLSGRLAAALLLRDTEK